MGSLQCTWLHSEAYMYNPEAYTSVSMQGFLENQLKICFLRWNWMLIWMLSHRCLGKLQFYKVKFDQNRNNIPKMARCDCLWIRQSQLIIINFLWASENSKEVVSTLQPRLFKRWIGLSTIKISDYLPDKVWETNCAIQWIEVYPLYNVKSTFWTPGART